MSIYFGNQKIKEVYFGNQKIKEVYKGNQLVYSSISAPQDGYWVHKDTNVKTYFGADAEFISDGIMSRPSWIRDAKEVKLCSGITGFHTEPYSAPPYVVGYSNVFWEEDVDISNNENPKNTILEALDMSLTSVTLLPYLIIVAMEVDSGTGGIQAVPFNLLELPPTLTIIDNEAISIATESTVIIKGFTNVLERIGGVFPWGGTNYPGIIILDANEHFLFTDLSNVPYLTNLINAENAAGRGVQGDYQILGE